MGEQDRVFAKCAWRLLPYLGVLFVINYFDRVNVGFAALTMNQDLGFSPTVFGFGAGVLFLGIFAFSIPSTVLLELVGARRWIALTCGAWGLLSASNAFVQDAVSFYIVRFLLGVAESGFVPGVLFYLTYWFPQAYRARVTAGFLAFAPLSVVIGGPISGLVLDIGDVAGLRSWQWLFLIEGLPAFLLAFVTLKVLPNGPAAASWLSTTEKSTIAARLAMEPPPDHRDLWPALHDPRVLALGCCFFGLLGGSYGISLWLPQMIGVMGYSNVATGFIVASIQVASMAAMFLWGQSSDRKSERIWHVAIPTLLAAGSVAFASVSPNSLVSIMAFAVTTLAIRSAYAPVLGLVSSFLTGAAAAGGVALVYSFGNLGAFAGPIVVGFFREQTGGYGTSMVALSFGLIVSAAIALGVGRFMTVRLLPLQTKT